MKRKNIKFQSDRYSHQNQSFTLKDINITCLLFYNKTRIQLLIKLSTSRDVEYHLL